MKSTHIPPPKAHLLRYKIDEIRMGLIKRGEEQNWNMFIALYLTEVRLYLGRQKFSS